MVIGSVFYPAFGRLRFVLGLGNFRLLQYLYVTCPDQKRNFEINPSRNEKVILKNFDACRKSEEVK